MPKKDIKILKSYGFRIGREIGSGSFGKVRLAQWTHNNRTKDMAVKIMDLKQATESYKKKFLPRELDIWPKMKHTNIIQVYCRATIRNRIYLFMEKAEKDVMQYLWEKGAVPETLAARWAGQLVGALQYCHAKGVAHRDLKCENLLLDKNTNLKLADFGFARVCMNQEGNRPLLSSTFCGTVAYTAPEILRGVPYDPFRTDVWSVGVCVYYMLCNCTPFDATNIPKMWKQQMSKMWMFTSDVEISQEGKRFIVKCLEPDALRRPALKSLLWYPWLKDQREKFDLENMSLE